MDDDLRGEVKRVYDAHAVVLEEINDRIKAVAEGHKMLDEKMDRKFDEMNERFDSLDRRVTDLEVKVSQMGNQLNRVEVSVEEVKVEVRAMRTELNQKVDRADWEALNERVGALEKRVGV